MLKIRTNLMFVDYNNLADRLLPELFRNVSEESNITLKLANELLVKNKVTNRLAKGVMRIVPQQAKDNVAYELLMRNKEKIVEGINKSLAENNIAIELSQLRMQDPQKSGKDMLKLELTVKDINYNQLIRNFLPKLLNGMAQQEEKQRELAKVFLELKEAPIMMLTAAFDILTQEEKETLTTKLLNLYSEEIMEVLNKKAEEQGISAEVAMLRFFSDCTKEEPFEPL